MNTNLRNFIKDIDKMSPDKKDSITYNTLKTLAEDLMLEELLMGEQDPVDFLIETLKGMKERQMRAHHERRLRELDEQEK